MRDQNDFLIEIQTEELPPKALLKLAKAFFDEVISRLNKAELAFAEATFFATPRRLAILVKNLAAKQADAIVERKGPAIEAAFDKEGNPTPACAGFARSCGITPDQLIRIEDKWVGYKQSVQGKKVQELLPVFIQQALAALPIPKRMRWGSGSVEFVRPVHGVIMLYGDDVIDAEILGVRTGRKTLGHRFMSQGEIEIRQPADYEEILTTQGHVIADFSKRQALIVEQAKKINPQVVIDNDLLTEVTALVEWPVAIGGHFDKAFLTVPQEALISAMQDHQRYFPVMDEKGKLQSQFVTISNIESKDPARVIAGNERVLRARLSDAAFFFETDKKNSLQSRVDNLKNMIFQAKLGTLHDKMQRVVKVAQWIAQQVNFDSELTIRAAMLAKTDLATQLVGEFPELQGIAGYYYALNDDEPEAVAIAMNEQYMPRFSGDQLPASLLGCALAVADRIDTLVGIFSIGMIPTGDKDPYGLRRAALGVLRILIERNIDLNVKELLTQATLALSTYTGQPIKSDLVNDVWTFMLERLKPWYQEQGISPDVFAAVAALDISNPYDFNCRIQAVQVFKNMPEAQSLSVANKRVSNILAKYDEKISAHDTDIKLFEVDAERILADRLQQQQDAIAELSQAAKYQDILAMLAHLRQPVDDFFDHVMVMTEDKPRRENRLLLLKKLRGLFLHVADIALLQ